MVHENCRTVTIIDYGLSYNSAAAQDKSLWHSGTSGYKDPSCINGNFHSMRLGDWWAFGQIAVLLLCGKCLYDYEHNNYNVLTPDEANAIKAPLRDVIVGLTSLPDQESRPKYINIIQALNLIVL
jgi:hypothetical protein